MSTKKLMFKFTRNYFFSLIWYVKINQIKVFILSKQPSVKLNMMLSAVMYGNLKPLK